MNISQATLKTTQAAHIVGQYELAGIVEESSLRIAMEARRSRMASRIYTESETRAKYRALINACVGLPDVALCITFLKVDGTHRTMLAQPYEVDADYTRKYSSVWDLEAEDYRRVNLDTIVKITVETHSVVAQYPGKHSA